MRDIQQKLSVARGAQPADLVFKNARVVNVFRGEIHKTNVAVEGSRVIDFVE
jgi:adenine deaminase